MEGVLRKKSLLLQAPDQSPPAAGHCKERGQRYLSAGSTQRSRPEVCFVWKFILHYHVFRIAEIVKEVGRRFELFATSFWVVSLVCSAVLGAEPAEVRPTALSPALHSNPKTSRLWQAKGTPDAPNQIIVRFRSPLTQNVGPAGMDAIASDVRILGRGNNRVALQAHGAGASYLDHLAVVTLKNGVAMNTAIARMNRRPDVLYAELNSRVHILGARESGRIPNDFEFDKLWNFRNTGWSEGTVGADVSATEAWELGIGSRRVKVAVIDTGIDYFHPDLVANIWVNNDIPGNGLDDDGNGFIDDVNGFDFVSRDGDPFDDHSHGTHVAGIIGATGNNRVGITGVCWEVTLMAIKAFDETGNATTSDTIEAIHYAVANGAQIINASWGQDDSSHALEEAVAAAIKAGVLFIAAAGNENTDARVYPAAFDHVVSVAATDRKDQRPRFSNYGARVDLAAPGEFIFSTMPDSRYEYFSGTSMAAPHVTGVAALILANHPEFSNRDVANILRNAVDPIKTDKPLGSGRLNARKALVVDAPLPFVQLDLPASLRGITPLRGSASGTNLAGYTLEYASVAAPSKWTKLTAAASPPTGGVLLDRFATAELDEGLYTFRITATNTTGQVSSERAAVSISNVHIDFPLPNDVLRAGDALEIRGSCFGNHRNYRIEYGKGPEPTIWSAAGIRLAADGSQDVLDGLLATWDTSAAEADQFYTLRLSATTDSKPAGEHFIRNVYLDSRLKRGWPQYIPIAGGLVTNDWKQITVADLDGNGRQTLLLVDPGNIEGKIGRLLAYNADGTLRWTRDLATGEPYWDVPVVGDIDGDGQLEIFVDVGKSKQLFAFRSDGTPLGGQWPVKLEAGGLGKTIADVNGDGVDDLIGYSQGTVDRAGKEMRQLIVLDGQGRTIVKWEIETCDAEIDAGRIFPAVANLDGEPGMEIVVPQGCHSLAAFSLAKLSGPLWVAPVDGQIVSSVVIGDLDRDGTPEIVVGTYDGRIKGASGALYVFDRTGKAFPGWPVLQGESFTSPPALGDLDGDGSLEICVLGRSTELLHVMKHWGFEIEGWPVGPMSSSSVLTSPVIGDLDGDGEPDVAIASPGYLYLAFTVGDMSYIGGVSAWNVSGRPIRLNPKRPALVMEGSGGAWHKAATLTLADIDYDGKLDLVATTVLDRAYGSPGDSGYRKGRSSIYVWELEVPFNNKRMPWPMLQGDAQHSGRFSEPRHTNQPPVIVLIPDQTIPAGGDFVAIPLDGFVEDPDNRPRELNWTVTGNTELKASISADRILKAGWPSATWTGSEMLRLVVADPGGLRGEATVTYTIRNGYVPPTAREDHVTTLEDTSVEFLPLGNDTDPEGRRLAVLSVSNPAFGKVKRDATDRLFYTPNPDAHGEDTFTYTIGNGNGGLAIGVVKVSVVPVNDAPAPATDYVITDEDTPVSIDVLANDIDVDGDAFSIVSFTQPEEGELWREGEGRFIYSPPTNYSGSVTFSYKVADPSGEAATAAVNILVKPVNDPPENPDQNFTVNRNATLEIIYTAEDVEKAPISYRVKTGPEHGELFTYPAVASYTPKKNFVGSDRIIYIANDGKADSRDISIDITVLDVNNAPAISDQQLITRGDQGLTVVLKASDLDGDAVTIQIAAPPNHGSIGGEGGNYLYQPNRGFLGDDSFSVEASDGAGGVTSATVHIQVTNENSAPVIEDILIRARVGASTPIELRATDKEANALTFTVLTQPATGTLSGTPPHLTYTPEPDFVGPDRFSFKAFDGFLESDPGSVLIAVDYFNHPAIATNQTMTIERNAATVVLLSVTDEDSDPLASPILKGPKHGRIFGRGTTFTYVPAQDFVGQDEFTYKVWDQHAYSQMAKVSISVTGGPGAGAPRIESVTPQADGSLRLLMRGVPGRTYELSVSTDLIQWASISTLAASESRLSFTDPNAAASNTRFYRVIQR